MVGLLYLYRRNVHGIKCGSVQYRTQGIDGEIKEDVTHREDAGVVDLVVVGIAAAAAAAAGIANKGQGDVDEEYHHGPNDSRNAKEMNDLVPSAAVINPVKSEGPGGVFESKEAPDDEVADSQTKEVGRQKADRGAVAVGVVVVVAAAAAFSARGNRAALRGRLYRLCFRHRFCSALSFVCVFFF